MPEAFLSVLTPTYNRGFFLPKLYQSLLEQTERNFCWVVIDDGSTDDTYDIIQQYIIDNKIPIIYRRKENGGKHTALNLGITFCRSELTIIVDSDDKLLPDATRRIREVYNKYKGNKNISTYAFLRCHSNGQPIICLEKDEIVSNYIDYRIKGNRPGDMAEVFKTDILAQYSFPVFNNEKFISEDVLWIQIAKKYNSVFINIPIYVTDYLDGGLTKSDKKIKFQSPLGSMCRGKMLMDPRCGIRSRVKGAIIYDCYSNLINGKIPKQLKLKKKSDRFITLLFKPIGKYFLTKWGKEID